jgi:oligopeptide/dipeptide ABC transporter ATP-binding protein
MYAGRIAETGDVHEIYRAPAHPYTEGLMHSIPHVEERTTSLTPIRGAPPSLARIPSGCPFHPRCPYVRDRCRHDRPPLYDVSTGYGLPDEEIPDVRATACHYFEEVLGPEGRDGD